MQPLHYVFLSFVQAATEFLPISSSGHLLFFKGLFHSSGIPILFDIVVHVGSLIAIVVFYSKRIGKTLGSAWLELIGKREEKYNSIFLFYIALSTVVTFVFYLILKDPIEMKYRSPSILFVTYLVTTGMLLLTYLEGKKDKSEIATKSVFLPIAVGLLQGFAIMPGISRSGLTISPLLLMGIRREEAAYYSFFLAIPAILGALVFKLFEMESIGFLIDHWETVVLCFGVSTLFSYLFLALLNLILRRGRFWTFSAYTLVMAVVSLIIFL